MKIRKAIRQDSEKVFNILQAANRKLIKEGMNHWRGFYKKDKVKKNIEERKTHIIEEKNNIIGVFNLSYSEPKIYKEGITKFDFNPIGKRIYLSGLAILPSIQQKGYGKETMNFIEKKSKKQKVKFIIFDVISTYKKLNQFYKKLNYKILGKINGTKATGNIYYKKL